MRLLLCLVKTLDCVSLVLRTVERTITSSNDFRSLSCFAQRFAWGLLFLLRLLLFESLEAGTPPGDFSGVADGTIRPRGPLTFRFLGFPNFRESFHFLVLQFFRLAARLTYAFKQKTPYGQTYLSVRRVQRNGFYSDLQDMCTTGSNPQPFLSVDSCILELCIGYWNAAFFGEFCWSLCCKTNVTWSIRANAPLNRNADIS